MFQLLKEHILLVALAVVFVFIDQAEANAIVVETELVCTYESSEGTALYGHKYRNMYDTSLEVCKQECTWAMDDCLSFNYKVNTNSCFLKSESKDTHQESLGKHSRSTYYHKTCSEATPTLQPTPPTTSPPTPSPDPESGDGSGSGFGSGSGDDITSVCFGEMGPVGGSGGSDFSGEDKMTHGDITGIYVTNGAHGLVDCIGFIRADGHEYCFGGMGATVHKVNFQAGEYITAVEGRQGNVIDQILFITNRGRYGPYGGSSGAPFSISFNGQKLEYITGKSGDLVDQVTFHLAC